MARKNRVSVYDGIYHVTTRIANRAMLLAECDGHGLEPVRRAELVDERREVLTLCECADVRQTLRITQSQPKITRATAVA